MKISRCILILCMVAPGVFFVRGQEVGGRDEVDVAALVEQLGNVKVRLRDEAEARLRALPEAVPALEEAAVAHPSAEGRARAEKIIRSMTQNRWHLSADLADGHLPGLSRPPFKIAVSADGKRFLTRGQDSACVWDVATLKPVSRFGVSNGMLPGWEASATVNAYDLSPDGKTAIISDDYGFLYRHDAASGDLAERWRQFGEEFDQSVPFNMKAVFSVSYTPDGKHIVTGGRNGYLVVLDAKTCKRVTAMQVSVHTYTHLIFSPDGRWLLAIEDFPGETDYISVIRTEGWELVGRQAIGDLLRAGVFMDEGRRFVGAGRRGYIATWDFDPETGEFGLEREWMRYGVEITGMLLGPDEKSLIVSSGKGGRALAELNFETRKVVWSHLTTPGIVALAVLGEDRFASVGWDHHVRVWKRTPPTAVQPPPPLVRTLADRNDPAQVHTLRLEATPHADGAVVVDAMVHLPQSGLIVTRGHDKVQVVSAMDLTEVRSFGPELTRLSGVKDRSNNGALAVTEDEKTVVVTDDAGSLLFFDLETGEETRRLKSPNQGGDGLDGGTQEVVWQILLDEEKGRIYTTDETAQLHVWDLESGEVVESIQLSGIGYELVMSPDGKWLAVLMGVGENIEQMFLRMEDMKAEIVFQVARYSHNTVGSFSADGEVFYRAFLDGRVMALYPSKDARVTNEILFRVPGQIVDVQVTEDGERAWVGSAYGPVPLGLWDLKTRQPVWLADGSHLPVWRMVVVAEDRVVCLCKDNKLRMYVRSAEGGMDE